MEKEGAQGSTWCVTGDKGVRHHRLKIQNVPQAMVRWVRSASRHLQSAHFLPAQQLWLFHHGFRRNKSWSPSERICERYHRVFHTNTGRRNVLPPTWWGFLPTISLLLIFVSAQQTNCMICFHKLCCSGLPRAVVQMHTAQFQALFGLHQSTQLPRWMGKNKNNDEDAYVQKPVPDKIYLEATQIYYVF